MIVFLVIFICMGIIFLFISNFVIKRLNEKVKELDTERFELLQQNWILTNEQIKRLKK